MDFLVSVQFIDDGSTNYVTWANSPEEAENQVIEHLLSEDSDMVHMLEDVYVVEFEQFEHGDSRDYPRV